MSRVFAISHTEKIKKITYVRAENEYEAEKLFSDGEAYIIDSFDEYIDSVDVHDVFEVEQ